MPGRDRWRLACLAPGWERSFQEEGSRYSRQGGTRAPYSRRRAFLTGETGSREAWWGGAGGSIAFVYLDARMLFSYVPNKWITGGYEQERGRRLLQAAYAALKVAMR